MKIAVHSDLHEDVYPNEESFLTVFDELPAVDVVILAGDCHRAADYIQFADKIRQRQQAQYAIIIAGNHEFYHCELHQGIQLMRDDAANNPHVFYLENDVLQIDGVDFIGATLWTNFEIFGADNKAAAIVEAGAVMLDYRRVRFNDAMLVAEDTVSLFNHSYAWLHQQLQTPGADRRIVITHHAPSAKCLSPKYADLLSSAAFASDLEKDIMQSEINYWIYGHTHYSQQIDISETMLVSNARGYMLEQGVTGYRSDFVIEI
ncbi:MAG: hypothetical protein A3F17_02870 [Gammaproteobacteria bacterium RIFCSPHIGHO2_12_FULL_41_15]|nr:MAG: hypothetical protein A3F17_02870 [Gammaproteobacteria bacterium RIFCSPHIGHO2_12_FULL_41_15]